MTPTEGAAPIADGKVVSIHYTLRDAAGEVLDSSRGGPPLEYLHGASNLLPGLERRLAGRAAGERFQAVVPPEEAYGERDPTRMQQVPRSSFPSDLALERGMRFGAEDAHGGRATVWIDAVEGDLVTIDHNHPLAGRTLDFEIAVESVRDATAEELAHGHAHGAHGHHHH